MLLLFLLTLLISSAQTVWLPHCRRAAGRHCAEPGALAGRLPPLAAEVSYPCLLCTPCSEACLCSTFARLHLHLTAAAACGGTRLRSKRVLPSPSLQHPPSHSSMLSMILTHEPFSSPRLMCAKACVKCNRLARSPRACKGLCILKAGNARVCFLHYHCYLCLTMLQPETQHGWSGCARVAGHGV